MITEKLQTGMKVDVDGISVDYGSIPGGLMEGWNGIVYYFQTTDAYDVEKHERIIKQVINKLESQSFDHWSEWRLVEVKSVAWDEYCQISLASFRVKDSY